MSTTAPATFTARDLLPLPECACQPDRSNPMTPTDTDTQTILLLAVEDRQGYSPSQVVERVREVMTLATLRQLVEDAIDQYGEDAQVVTDNGDQYGARFGVLDTYRDTFIPTEADEDESWQ